MARDDGRIGGLMCRTTPAPRRRGRLGSAHRATQRRPQYPLTPFGNSRPNITLDFLHHEFDELPTIEQLMQWVELPEGASNLLYFPKKPKKQGDFMVEHSFLPRLPTHNYLSLVWQTLVAGHRQGHVLVNGRGNELSFSDDYMQPFMGHGKLFTPDQLPPGPLKREALGLGAADPLKPLYDENRLAMNFVRPGFHFRGFIPTREAVQAHLQLPMDQGGKLVFFPNLPIGDLDTFEQYSFNLGSFQDGKMQHILERLAEGEGPRIILVNQAGHRSWIEYFVDSFLAPLGYNGTPPELGPASGRRGAILETTGARYWPEARPTPVDLRRLTL